MGWEPRTPGKLGAVFLVAVTFAVLTSPATGCSRSSEEADDAVSDSGSPIESTTSTRVVPEVAERSDWAKPFDNAGVMGTIAVREVGSKVTEVFDLERARTQRIPASTFKILNSMVILETGVLPDADTIVPWDGIEREVPAWNMDHSLRSGIEVSAVWLFQRLAREVGPERMSELLEQSGYGNASIGGGIDQFWLTGDLRISPLEQIDFLEAMLDGDLPFSEQVVESARDILVRERGVDWTWSYKTGTARSEEPELGWLVGYVEREETAWVFALNIDQQAADGAALLDSLARQKIARAVLGDVGALPQ